MSPVLCFQFFVFLREFWQRFWCCISETEQLDVDPVWFSESGGRESDSGAGLMLNWVPFLFYELYLLYCTSASLSFTLVWNCVPEVNVLNIFTLVLKLFFTSGLNLLNEMLSRHLLQPGRDWIFWLYSDVNIWEKEKMIVKNVYIT